MITMKNVKMVEILCPGCGKEIHSFHIPSQPGAYRLRCHSNHDKRIIITMHEDGSIFSVEEMNNEQ